ncbi:hypothetical protein [Wolbachia endosymbiont of Aedes albopictus]|nr:hypothetical protein [Wolbachia endosymbiont of Aedes albopictus]UVW83771.1 hypothetical protein NHG98_05440 [Wolbachia endosymbiont of Aedes albopictus]
MLHNCTNIVLPEGQCLLSKYPLLVIPVPISLSSQCVTLGSHFIL